MKILIVYGPNLNLLGTREPDVYGTLTLEKINEELVLYAQNLGVEIEFFQSNIEGEIVDKIQQSRNDCQGIVINPAAYTHTSVAIRDAIAAVNLPSVEVHISNIHKREEFRKHSFIAPVCIGQIAGFGLDSYKLGLNAVVNFLSQKYLGLKIKYCFCYNHNIFEKHV